MVKQNFHLPNMLKKHRLSMVLSRQIRLGGRVGGSRVTVEGQALQLNSTPESK
jgi:hypothetical protein